MEETYKHYGVEVRRIFTYEDIDIIIKDHKATLMPIIDPDYKVAFFKHDGIHNTYMVIPRAKGKYYLTNQIPKDLDFGNLVDDIEQQSRGYEPDRMESYIHTLYRHIEDMIAAELVNTEDIFNGKCEPFPRDLIRDALGQYGFFSFDDISSLPAQNYWDVDMEYIRKIFEE